jgi:ribonuclease T
LVGHNAHFDLGFLQAAIARTGTKNQNPFHSFSVFDTVTLSAVMFGQTVLASHVFKLGLSSMVKRPTRLYTTLKRPLNCFVIF